MDIYILRHGKAEQHAPTVAGDYRRKLTEAGKKDMERIAKAIKGMGIRPDSIISSPLVRARQTAKIASEHVKSRRRSVQIWEELKPEIDVGMTIKRLLAMKPTSSVMLVGHEPHLSTLIGAIISGNTGRNACVSLKKGGLAHLQADVGRSGLQGCIASLLAPRQLRSLS